MKRTALMLTAVIAAASAARAETDVFEFFKEEAKVVTASRREEPAWRAPAAVDVVTADEIRAYGYREIWDALRYRAGIDVIKGRSLDGNRALVSARGFDREFVTEMQVLIDGRSVYSPFLGGVYWQSLPVQIQDVERIEIVRGPNAALYGSNAALGVINIITKKPGASNGAAASLWAGNRSARDAAGAVQAAGTSSGLRVSAETRYDQGHPTDRGASVGDDFLRSTKMNVRGRWNPDPRTELEILGGASWMTAGLPGLESDARAEHLQDFVSARGSRRFDDDSAFEVSLSRSEMNVESEPLFAGDVRIRMYQYDAEILHRFAWLDGRVQSNWGGDYRVSSVESDQAFAGRPNQENRVVRAFTHHSIRLIDPLTLVGGVSLERSDTGGAQPAAQAALVATPSDQHSLRLSFSKASTLPPLFDRQGNYALSATRRFAGNPNFEPEKISSCELGWNGRFFGGEIRPSAALYYMDVVDMSFLNVRAGGPGAILSVDNSERALARGAELSLETSLGRGRSAFVNYTFESITHQRGVTATGEDFDRSTPTHKFNVGARTKLPAGFALAAVVGYKDSYRINSDSRGTSASIPSHFRLDARLGWTPRPGWELFVAGQELLQPAFAEYVDGTATPRTIRAGVDARFGF